MIEESAPQLTQISQLGEFGLIEHITRKFQANRIETVKAVGDDAAVIRPAEDHLQVFSTDLLLENVHFDLAYVPLRHLGYKAVAVNLSDIFAMNAIPYGIVVSLGLSSRFPVEAVEELYAGIQMACERYHVDLLGGDTTSSRQGLVISVTAFGQAKEEEVVYRSGAQPNNLICVTGDLGAAYAGLVVLDREKVTYQNRPHEQPDLSDYDYVVGRQLKPEARGDVIQRLREIGVRPTSMMDVSDGIASELHHICRQSKVGAMVFAAKLPLDFQTLRVADEFNIAPTTFAMNGGEDYELIFTVALSDFEKIKGEKEIHIVGKITEHAGDVEIVLEDGSVAKVEAQGWNHLRE